MVKNAYAGRQQEVVDVTQWEEAVIAHGPRPVVCGRPVMDRSPRRAGAAAGVPLRSFAIFLVIAITTTQTAVSGFTIRERVTTDTIIDLTAEGSSLLEVKHDVGITDKKAIDVKRDDGDLDTTVIAINKTDLRMLENKKSNFNEVEINTNAAKSTKLKTTTLSTKGISRNDFVTNEVATLRPATKVPVDKENSIEIHDITLSSDPSLKQTSMSDITNIRPTTNPINIDDIKLSPTFAITRIDAENFTSTVPNLTESLENNSTESSTIDNTKQAKIETSSFTDSLRTINDVSLSTVVAEIESDTFEPEPTTDWVKTHSEMYTVRNDTTQFAVTDTNTINPSTELYSTDSTTDKQTATTTPTELLTKIQFTGKENMVKSESLQTHITLENEGLRRKLMNDDHTSAVQQETRNVTEDYISTSPKLDSSFPIQMMSHKAAAIKLDVVSSKRGGYLDNTETTTAKLEIHNISYTEMFGPYETEPSEGDALEHKTSNGAESQSQLVEDAIKEELLKEETINDNQENAKRYIDEEVKSLDDKSYTQNSLVNELVNGVPTDDALSVKLITNDKKINTSLYAVSPNYKPLKKIDVQPPKQFVRDPDDNSWRNESISSLGIVFKPKNSSKSFKQVLKNKTETELNSTSEKDNKAEMPDLRVRLEKIAEVRKSKKKKTNKFGEVVYTDYDSVENTNGTVNDTTPPVTSFLDSILSFTTPETTPKSDHSVKKEKIDIFNMKDPSFLTTSKPKKYFNIVEYYDTTDEYDADYLKVTKIDLQKFTKPPPIKTTETTTRAPEIFYTTPLSNYLPDRRPTVQYFPPTKKVTPKIKVEDYDTDFQRKLNLYTEIKDTPKNVLPVSYGTVSSTQTETDPIRVTTKPEFTPIYNPEKNLYLTQQAHVTEQQDGYVNDGNFNRASYVIKHYKDFINEAAKDNDEDRPIDYFPFTESPVRGVTINELSKLTEKDMKSPDEDYDYEFRKDLMNRFIDNFNQNSERFKVDFPILYNSSVVHRKIPNSGKVFASSRAYLKRQYEGPHTPRARSCEPLCNKLSVDLAPDYELHYYVPEQEEKEVVEQRQMSAPFRYRTTQL